MDELARTTRPFIKLRDNWVAVDSSVDQAGAQAADPHRHPRPGAGGDAHRGRRRRGRRLRGGRGREPAEGARAGAAGGHRDARPGAGGARRPSCATTSARASPGWPELTSLGLGACLADDMGLGKTMQVLALHPAPARRRRARPARRSSSARPRLLGNWEREAARFAPRPARAALTTAASAHLDGSLRRRGPCSPPTGCCAATSRRWPTCALGARGRSTRRRT